MKISTNRISLLVIATVMTTLLFSCQKESNSNESNSTTLTEDEFIAFTDESIQAEASFDDVGDIGMIAAEEESDATMYGRTANNARRLPTFDELRLRLGPCASVTVSPNDSTYPKTITIDFGPDGCWCTDGKHRRGAIIVHLTGPIRRSGSVMTITFRDFYLNRAHIEGTQVLSNLSENGNIKFTVQVVGGKVTFPNGRGYKYNGLKYVKQVEGGSTRVIRDDIYTIEGRSKTEFNNGLTVQLNTESPLVKKVVCPWISNGTLKVKINDRVLFLDHGAPSNGDCDNKALLTWNNGNNQRLITLP